MVELVIVSCIDLKLHICQGSNFKEKLEVSFKTFIEIKLKDTYSFAIFLDKNDYFLIFK